MRTVVEAVRQIADAPWCVLHKGDQWHAVGLDLDDVKDFIELIPQERFSLNDLTLDPATASHRLVAGMPLLRSIAGVRSLGYTLVFGSPHVKKYSNETLDLAAALIVMLARSGGDEAALHAVYEASLLGVLLIDGVGRIIDCNPAAADILGKPAKHLRSQPFLHAVRGNQDEMEWEPFDELLAGTWMFDHYQVNRRYERPGRSRTHARLTISAVNDSANSKVKAVCMVEDLTQLIATENQLRRAKVMAEVASLAKSNFLATMSHEVRTPLNSIIGFTNVILENDGVTKEKETLYLQRVRANGLHLLDLINDILDISKLQAEKVQVEIVDADLGELVRETAADLEGRVLGTNVELSLHIPGNIQPVRTDPDKFRQILINLMGNAIKFTEAGTVRVVLHADTEGRIERLDVVDTGIGIPEDRIERIFEAFEQADIGTTRKFKGTGLGLAICKSLCDLIGHSISVASEEGVGSTFSVHFDPPPHGHPTP